MKCILALALLAVAAGRALRAPIYSGKVDSNAKFAASAQDGDVARAPGYRNAWDDCGGIGASATERTRTIAAKIKGWAKPIPFVRHAAQAPRSRAPPGRAWSAQQRRWPSTPQRRSEQL